MTYDELFVYTDGGARGNPGPSACAVVIKDADGKIVHEESKFLGDNTNNIAEYTGLVLALTLARKFSTKKINCVSDSELMVNQMTGKYKVRAAHLLDLYDQAKEREAVFDEVTYRHVPRSDPNIVLADALVNACLDEVAHAKSKKTNPFP